MSRLAALGVASLAGTPVARLFAQPGASSGRGRAFNIVVLGDSIGWGQGLRPSEKYPALVAAWLQQELTDAPEVNVFSYARSGAIIQPSATDDDAFTSYGASASDPAREVPNSYPSITKQVDLARADLTARRITRFDVDIVLLDGGINDVGVTNILTVDPTIADKNAWVARRTREACGTSMHTLLMKTLEAFPNAIVVVTNYFFIVSRESTLLDVGALLGALGLVGASAAGLVAGVAVTPILLNELANQCTTFHTESNVALSDAVARANREGGEGRALFAHVGFGAHHAYGAPQSLLFRVFEDDPARSARGTACVKAGQDLNVKCLNASMGHPNQLGAQRYANTIISQLRLKIPECAA